ncbi:DNA helicase, partial [Trypanosoma conorhini]
TPPHSQRQATLHEVVGSCPSTSIAQANPPRNPSAFRVSVAAITPTKCTGASNPPGLSKNTTLCGSLVSHPVRTLFLSRPAAATSASACSSVKPSGGAATAASDVASAARKEEALSLAPAPRSEELRRYNARRTLFTLGSVVVKRPRTDDREDHTP